MGISTRAYIAKKINKEEIVAYLQQYDKTVNVSEGVYCGKPEFAYSFIYFNYDGHRQSMYFSNSESTNNEVKYQGIIPHFTVNPNYDYTLISLGKTDATVKLIREICEKFGGGYFTTDDCDGIYERIYPTENAEDEPLPELRVVTLDEIREKFGEHVVINLDNEIVSAVLKQEHLKWIKTIASSIKDEEFQNKFGSLSEEDLLNVVCLTKEKSHIFKYEVEALKNIITEDKFSKEYFENSINSEEYEYDN